MSSANRHNANPVAERNKHGNRGGWLFLLAVLGLHLGVHLTKPTYSAESLDYFIAALIRLLPAFGIMFLLLWLFSLFAAPQRITRSLGRHSGIKSWLYAIAGGVLSMGPLYLWYPLLGDLQAKGMRTSLLAAFLYSRAVKIPMLPFMMHYFGTVYATLFVIHVLLFSVVSGLLMERISPMKSEHDITGNN